MKTCSWTLPHLHAFSKLILNSALLQYYSHHVVSQHTWHLLQTCLNLAFLLAPLHLLSSLASPVLDLGCSPLKVMSQEPWPPRLPQERISAGNLKGQKVAACKKFLLTPVQQGHSGWLCCLTEYDKFAENFPASLTSSL